MKNTLKQGKDWLNKDVRDQISHLQEELRVVRANTNIIKEKVTNHGVMTVSPTEIVTKIFTGLKFYLDPRDISVTPHLVLDGIYEGHISNAWLSLIEEADTVFDIGANFGYFGALAAQRTDRKRSKVIYFEANPELIPYIKKTLGVNWLNEQSVVENLAVAEKQGTVTLHVLKDYVGSSSLHSADHLKEYMDGKMYLQQEKAIKVKAVTLDEYCHDNKITAIDLIKMDIEGYEEAAYEGMRGIIKKSPRATMFIEFTKQSYQDSKGFFEKLLKDFGNLYLIDENGRLYKPSSTSYAEVIDATDDWVMPVFSKRPDLDEAG